MVVVPCAAKIFRLDQGARFQRIDRSAAAVFYGGPDAAAFAGDLFVGGSGDAVFVFMGAAARENQVSVGIDEAGEDDFAVQVDFFGFARFGMIFDAAAGADGGDAVFVDQDCAVANDGEVIEGFATAGNGAAQGEQLRAAGDEPVGHDAAILTPRRRKDYWGCAIVHRRAVRSRMALSSRIARESMDEILRRRRRSSG